MDNNGKSKRFFSGNHLKRKNIPQKYWENHSFCIEK